MQPSGKHLGSAERPGFPSKDQESGLERVLRGVANAERPTADSEHDRAVAVDQCGECLVVAMAREPVQQHGIGLGDGRPEPEQAKDRFVRLLMRWSQPGTRSHITLSSVSSCVLRAGFPEIWGG